MPTTIRTPTTKWTDGSSPTITKAEWAAFDAALFAAINAVRGGTWAPAAKLIFNTDNAEIEITGPLVVSGSGAQLKSWDFGGTGVASFTFLGSDRPVYAAGHSGRTRSILTACGLGKLVTVLSSVTYAHGTEGTYVDLTLARTDGAMQPVAHRIDAKAWELVTRAKVPLKFLLPLRAHDGDGATLSSVVVKFRVHEMRATAEAPVTMPKLRAVRIAADGEVTPMSTTATGADADGYFSPPSVSTGSAWYAGGAAQSITITCDTANTIDVDTYSYAVEVIEEQGVDGYPWTLNLASPCRVATTANVNLGSAGLATIDAVSLSSGDRVLVKDQTVTTENGIYTASPGAWSRDEDLEIPSDFVRGTIVPIEAGDTQGGTLWQLQEDHTDLASFTRGITFRTKPDAVNGSEGTALIAHGNIYYSARATYTNIPGGGFA